MRWQGAGGAAGVGAAADPDLTFTFCKSDIKPDFPDVDADTFLQKPLMERMRILGLNWAENGFGSPRMVHTVYIAKLVFFYALGAILVANVDVGAARVLACRWTPDNLGTIPDNCFE